MKNTPTNPTLARGKYIDFAPVSRTQKPATAAPRRPATLTRSAAHSAPKPTARPGVISSQTAVVRKYSETTTILYPNLKDSKLTVGEAVAKHQSAQQPIENFTHQTSQSAQQPSSDQAHRSPVEPQTRQEQHLASSAQEESFVAVRKAQSRAETAPSPAVRQTPAPSPVVRQASAPSSAASQTSAPAEHVATLSEAPDANRFVLGGKSPFITNKVEKRPLSSSIPEGYRAGHKNIYSKSATAVQTTKAPSNTIIVDQRKNSISLAIAIILVLILGSVVGAIAYLAFFQ